MQEWTIGEVARRTNLRPSTLRYYEQIGLLPIAKRVQGRRMYDRVVVQQLVLIKGAQHAGFTLAEIQTLVHGFTVSTPPSARWRALAHPKLAEIEAQITRLHAMQQLLEAGLQCTCTTLDECELCREAADEQLGEDGIT